MTDKIDQAIKGDNNSQIIVQGNYVVGLNEEEVISLIKKFGYVNKNEVVALVQKTMNNIQDEKNLAK